MLGFLRRGGGPAKPRVAITGATGGLGGAVVRGLLSHRPAATIRAVGRDAGRLAQLAGFGVETAAADYDDLGSLVAALHDVDTVLLVPTGETAQLASQHARVLRAARECMVRRIAYVGMQPTGRFPVLDRAHADTESMLQASGLEWSVLRTNLHMARFLPDVEAAMRLGYHATSIGGGGAALVDRADVARAAVAVLEDPSRARRTYTITGPASVTALDVAAVASRLAGRPIPVQHLSRQGMEEHLRGLGQAPGPTQEKLVLEDALRDGSLSAPSGDLEALTGQAGKDFLAFARQRLGKAPHAP